MLLLARFIQFHIKDQIQHHLLVLIFILLLPNLQQVRIYQQIILQVQEVQVFLQLKQLKDGYVHQLDYIALVLK